MSPPLLISNIMLHFNELYITEDGKTLIIDVEMEGSSEYNDCYLDHIEVDAGSSCPSLFTNPVTVWKRPDVFDLDGDGEVTENDIQWLRTISKISGAIAPKSGEETDVYQIGFNSGYYYRIKDPESDTLSYIKVPISSELYKLCLDIVNQYYGIYDSSRKNSLDPRAICRYLMDGLDSGVYLAIRSVLGTTSELTDVPGDIDGDSEVKVADINALIDFMIATMNNSSLSIKETTKRKRLCIPYNDENLVRLTKDANKTLSDLFFVRAYSTCSVESAADTDCGCVSNVITGAAYNGKPLYDTAVRHADSYGNTCATNDLSQFVDWLLRYYGFQFALKSGDLCQAYYYWSNYLSGTAAPGLSASNSCGCRGTR